VPQFRVMYFGDPKSERKVVHAETIVSSTETAELVARARLAALQATHHITGYRVVDAVGNTIARANVDDR
jgi:hypothetical protein